MVALKFTILLVACTLIPAAVSDSSNVDTIKEDRPFSNPTIDEEIVYLNNLMDEYNRRVNPRLSVDANYPRNQEMYKMWKRNADIINTLLGFPRRMLLAGR